MTTVEHFMDAVRLPLTNIALRERPHLAAGDKLTTKTGELLRECMPDIGQEHSGELCFRLLWSEIFMISSAMLRQKWISNFVILY